MKHDPLRDAHTLLRAAVPVKRRMLKTDSVLAQSIHAAMEHWDAQKADGVPLRDRVAGLEQTVRACWPFTREWKCLCHDCGDVGLVMAMCPGDATCGRHKPHIAHDYGSPCWCSLGSKFRDKPKPGADDFSQAGKSKPKDKPFTKWGR